MCPMKKNRYKHMRKILLSVSLIAVCLTTYAQVGIGTNAPSASAALEVNSKTQGFLMPRMRKAQMEAIKAPAEGLMVYCLDCTPKGFHVYNGRGFINANTGEYLDGPDKIAAIVAASTVPAAGGTPSLADLAAAHVTNATGNQAAYEEAIARASPVPTTLRELQGIIDSENFCLSVLSSSVAVTVVVPVKNPKTGRVWMDRNLGASRAATSSTDEAAYGDLYQWGRKKDGHQLRRSCSVTGPVTAGSEGYKFVGNPLNNGYNWLITRDDKRWNLGDVNTIIKSANDPCPDGYRVPSRKELDNERQSWKSNDAAGAFASPLKWPLAGYRSRGGGSEPHISLGTRSIYWSNENTSTSGATLEFNHLNSKMAGYSRAYGFSVRCIKE